MKVIFSKDTSTMWSENHEHNVMFLTYMQNFYNDKLRIAGVVSLTDILKDLGFNEDIVADGLRNVWIDGYNDGFVDFGLGMDINKKFLKGEQDYAVLEFNTFDFSEPLLELTMKGGTKIIMESI